MHWVYSIGFIVEGLRKKNIKKSSGSKALLFRSWIRVKMKKKCGKIKFPAHGLLGPKIALKLQFKLQTPCMFRPNNKYNSFQN